MKATVAATVSHPSVRGSGTHSETSKQDFNLRLTQHRLERLLYRLSISAQTGKPGVPAKGMQRPYRRGAVSMGSAVRGLG